MNVIALENIEALSVALERAIREGSPIGPAIESFVKPIPTLGQVRKFLMGLDVTIHIADDGPRYRRLPDDEVVLYDPSLTELSTWYSVALHEFLHWTEWRTGWVQSPDLCELRAEVGQAILERLLAHPFDYQLGNYFRWRERWIKKIDADPDNLLNALRSAIAGVELIVERAGNQTVDTPERANINQCLSKLLDYIGEKQVV